MNRGISKLSNHYIVCGWGNTGYYVLEELDRTRRPCAVVMTALSSAVLRFPSSHQDSAEIVFTIDLGAGPKGIDKPDLRETSI